MNRDYSSVLRGERPRNQQQQDDWEEEGNQGNQGGQGNRSRNREMRGSEGGGRQHGGGGQGGGQSKTRSALANTLGSAAEAAKAQGIPAKLAHRIVTAAFG